MAVTTRSQSRRRKLKLIFRKKQATVEKESQKLQNQATEQEYRTISQRVRALAPSTAALSEQEAKIKHYQLRRERAIWIQNELPPLPWEDYTGEKPLEGRKGPCEGEEWNWNFSWQQREGTGAALHDPSPGEPNPVVNVRRINCRIRVPGSDIVEHHRKGRVELCGPDRKPWTRQGEAREA
ncbi:MAG: hypothetical protein Q9174_005965 [Haloplaca sp. 1 TL-2023]